MSRRTGDGRPSRPWLLLGEKPKTMGGRIRRLRIGARLTQTALAARTCELAGIEGGLTKSYISLLEADRTQPSVRTLAGIAAALGCSMNYLFWGQETGAVRQAPEVRAAIVVERRPAAPMKPAPRLRVSITRRDVDGTVSMDERRLSDEAARRLTATQEGGAPAPNDAGAPAAPHGGADRAAARASLPEGQTGRG